MISIPNRRFVLIEQPNIFRVSQLIARLRNPFGCNKDEVARDFEVKNPLQKILPDKLYALTYLDDMSETLYKQSVIRNISLIRNIIKLPPKREYRILILRHIALL